MKVVSFRLEVEPRGQGRPRIGVVAGHGIAFKDAKSREHESTLRALCAPYRPKDKDGNPVLLQGPVQLVVVAVMPRTAELNRTSTRKGSEGKPLRPVNSRWHITTPDVDNIVKGLLDAMRDWWTDDCQVSALIAVKRMAAFGEAPHYSVMVSEICPAELWSTLHCMRFEASDFHADHLTMTALPF